MTTGTANPLAGKIAFAIGRGTSQSGNYLRSFMHLGFNQDESKRIVFDGLNPNIAVRQNPMNFRFAVPGGAADLYQPGSDGIVWWSDYADEARHQRAGGLLDRCNATKTCPKIFETFGSSEFWGLRASPDLVGTKADRDIPLPANVRRYYFPGVTHGGGRGGFSTAKPTRVGALRVARQSESIVGYDARFDRSTGRLGHERRGAACQPVSAISIAASWCSRRSRRSVLRLFPACRCRTAS